MAFDRWQVEGDMWHVTHDAWHMTHDMWHTTHSVGWTFSPNFISLAFPVLDWQCLEDIWTNKGWIDELINESVTEADCRTALSTQGMLNIYKHVFGCNWEGKNK